MKRSFIAVVLCLFAVTTGHAQTDEAEWRKGLNAYWEEIDGTFRDSARSPLLPAERSEFQRVDRYDPDPAYRVQAKFKAKAGREFGMPTTTDRRPMYRSIGSLTFQLGGRKQRLTVYRNMELTTRPEYTNHLFVPFTDATNGISTYGGGRYIDLEGPMGPLVELDLNRAYNPYCAYGGRYSCPIPPPENHLQVPVEAGARMTPH